MESLRTYIPDEIILRILSFSNPLDVVRHVRLVSKRFRGITDDLGLWRLLYANARLPRPPGPYLSQSAQFLERTLIQSARLEQSWVAEPFQEISCKRIPIGELTRYRVVCRKWLVTCESVTTFVVCDIDSDTHPRQIIWKNDRPVSDWDASSVTSVEGEVVYILMCETMAGKTHSSWRWKLLEFHVNGNSAPVFYSSLDIPASEYKTPGSLITQNSSILYIENVGLFFDTRARMFHKFPEFRTELDETLLQNVPGMQSVWLTRTHILVFTQKVRPPRFCVLIQAFALSADPHSILDEPSALCLTHEFLTNYILFPMSLIRESTVDPLTGSTDIRFLRRIHDLRGNELSFSCVDIKLAESHDDAVRPIHIDIRDLFSVKFPITPWIEIPLHIEASEDGYVRGLCRIFDIESEGQTREFYNLKFTIDAARDECVSRVGQFAPSEARWKGDRRSPAFEWFDGVRGWLGNYRSIDTHGESDPKVMATLISVIRVHDCRTHLDLQASLCPVQRLWRLESSLHRLTRSGAHHDIGREILPLHPRRQRRSRRLDHRRLTAKRLTTPSTESTIE